MKKCYDFGEGWEADMEKVPTGHFILIMNTPAGSFRTVHRDEMQAVKEMLSYFAISPDDKIEL